MPSRTISLVSIDDSELALLGDVTLTSIPHPKDKLGEKAALNLLKMIQNPDYDGTYEFSADIVERESVIILGYADLNPFFCILEFLIACQDNDFCPWELFFYQPA